jgi:hypothetical protein
MFRSVCQRRGESRDPTGVVHSDAEGELQALRAQRDIIRAHKDWTSEQVDEELVRAIFTPKRRARIESTYAWVEKSIEAFIDRQPDAVFGAAEKKTLKRRVRATSLQLPPPASVYADEPDLFTKNDVFYERAANGGMRMRVGGAYLLSAKSWFNVVFTLAHEFGHSIDPCELKVAKISIPAYRPLAACFIKQGVIAAPPDRQECGENDQLSETFADWIAVQVVSEALAHYATEFHDAVSLTNAAANSVRDLCEQEEGEFETLLHPSPEIRIERIFGRNPSVRRTLGCEDTVPETPYCDFSYIERQDDRPLPLMHNEAHP